MSENIFKWYAVYTKPRWEKKVAFLLEKKRVENYCPLNCVLKQWSDRKKIVLEPLFTSYVFVRIEQQNQLSIRQTDGIINFVYWLHKPAIIPDEEINIIKKFLSNYENIHLEKADIDVNDQVRIVSGPLMSREGSVVAIMNRTIKIKLPHLGCIMVAEVNKTNVEKITISTFSGEPIKSYIL
jgi:transcription antitermination factor NusG